MAVTETSTVPLAGRPGAALAPPERLRTIEGLGERARPVTLAGQHLLPVPPACAGLLPGGGLRRGSTVAVAGSTSLALALVSAASQAGSWCAVVGRPSLGLLAAAELGLDLSRLALVASPGQQWPTVTAALVDALDIVVVAVPPRVRLADARRLAARARERGAVLVPLGGSWPQPDVCLTVEAIGWEGLGGGHGHLRRGHLRVRAGGRGAAARPRQVSLWLPSLELASGDEGGGEGAGEGRGEP